MQYVRAPISTVCIGRAASFGTVIFDGRREGPALSLPSSNIHMHQPLISGRGMAGQATDLDIHAKEIIRIKKSAQRADRDATPVSRWSESRRHDRDYFLTPQEAVEYGLIDGIIQSTSVPALVATK